MFACAMPGCVEVYDLSFPYVAQLMGKTRLVYIESIFV